MIVILLVLSVNQVLDALNLLDHHIHTIEAEEAEVEAIQNNIEINLKQICLNTQFIHPFTMMLPYREMKSSCLAAIAHLLLKIRQSQSLLCPSLVF